MDWDYNPLNIYFWLVVQFHHLEKWWSESQLVSDDIPYMKWKIKKIMFQTTNQMMVLMGKSLHKLVIFQLAMFD